MRNDFREKIQVLSDKANDLRRKLDDPYRHETHRLFMLSQLKQVSIALLKIRITPAAYGSCEKCEELIEEARLAIIPEAQFCVDCAEEQEKLQRKTAPELTDLAKDCETFSPEDPHENIVARFKAAEV
ncbi:TraR/DksA C4-type zinc finger protein [Patescibacteria group bacterium]|nr:TraR/DksA C4-type zinc finger protein [Patescibacteria group bacterium]